MNASNVVGQGILVGQIIYKIGLIVLFKIKILYPLLELVPAG